MYFRELETLRVRSFRAPGLVEALDAYLQRLAAPARSSARKRGTELVELNPRIMAQELRAPLPEVIDLLEAGVESGVFRHRFHVWCPVENAGLRWLESLPQVSETFDCDLCDEGPHNYTPDGVEVRYALTREPG